MTKPHKHAELIKAWADGADIEFRYEGHHTWKTAGDSPSWNVYTQYRIKSQPVVKYHGIMQGTDGYEGDYHNTGYHADPLHVRSSDPNNWKVIAIVKTIFVDNVPVSVEIV